MVTGGFKQKVNTARDRDAVAAPRGRAPFRDRGNRSMHRTPRILCSARPRKSGDRLLRP
jgi:hypothetical protein